MNRMDNDSETCECSRDVAAYALGALDPGEHEAFRTHLDSCVACGGELEAFEQVVNVLPVGVPEHRAPRACASGSSRPLSEGPVPTAPKRLGAEGIRCG